MRNINNRQKPRRKEYFGEMGRNYKKMAREKKKEKA